jgi:hypothetical protein
LVPLAITPIGSADQDSNQPQSNGLLWARSAIAGMREMSDPTDVGEHDTTTYAEGYGDNVLITTVDNNGRQLIQVVVRADDAGELVRILGSKLNVS